MISLPAHPEKRASKSTIVTLVAGMLAIILGICVWVARATDDISTAAEAHTLRQGFQHHVSRYGTNVDMVAIGDTAPLRLGAWHADRAFVQDIATPLTGRFGHDAVFLVEQGRVRFASERAHDLPEGLSDRILALAAPMLGAMTAMPSREGAALNPGHVEGQFFIVAEGEEGRIAYRRETHMAQLDGVPLVVTVARIVPASLRTFEVTRNDPARLLISVVRLSPERVGAIGEVFGFPDLSLLPPTVERGAALFAVKDDFGATIGNMSWTPRLPGTRMMLQVAPVVAAAVGVFALLVVLGFRRLDAATDRLRRSEDRLRAFAEGASDWFWETDADHRFHDFSARQSDIPGLGTAALLGKRREDLPVLDEDRPVLAALRKKLDAREAFKDVTYRIAMSDGGYIGIRARGNPVFDNRGTFLGYRGTALDVTAEVAAREAEHRAHRELQKRSALLSRVLATVKLGHFRRTAVDAPASWVSAELADIYGIELPADGMIPIGVIRKLVLDTPERLARLSADHDRCWADGTPYRFATRLRRSDGTVIDIEVRGHAERDEAGDIVAVLGTVRDVTVEADAARAVAEAGHRVARQNALMSRAMVLGKAGLWRRETARPDTLWISPELSRLLALDETSDGNVPRDTLISRYLDLTPDVVGMYARRAWTDNVMEPMRTRFLRGDGTVIHVEVMGELERDADGAPSAIFGFIRDRTDEVLAKEEIEEKGRALRDRTALLSRSMRIARMGHWRATNVEGDPLWVSAELAELWDLEQGEGLVSLATIHEGDVGELADAQREAFMATWATGRAHTATSRYRTRFGAELDIVAHMEAEFDEAGAVVAVNGVVRDVTEESRAMTAVEQSRAELRRRSDELAEAQMLGRSGSWTYRFETDQLVFSPEMFVLLSLDPGTFDGRRKTAMAAYRDGTGDALLAAQAEVMRTREPKTIDVRLARGDGTVGDFSITTRVDLDVVGNIVGFVGTVQDISERKAAERELETLAYADPLTGLANRARFHLEIGTLLRDVLNKRSHGALLLLDLDRFKEVNDSLGHAAGDELLIQFTGLLRRVLPSSSFLARIGGDEFAIILPGIERDEAAMHADAIVTEATNPFRLRLGEVLIGASIGIAMIPDHGSDADTALRHADLALYAAKDNGRGRAEFFVEALSESAQAKIRLARALRVALDQGDQLELRFQPQVELRSGRVTGFETLLRWKHPERGYVPPSEFIPVAENSSLICDIGVFVLRESCGRMRAWLDAGHPKRTVSVNVSPAQLWQSDFDEDVRSALRDTGLPADHLVLEVTESVFAADAEGRVRAVLTKLRALGVKLALDDFGTGYSSLGYLNQLPFEKLKIDRCFVDGIETDRRKRELLRGIVALGRGLGLMTIAEGAERMGEVEILRGLGCDCVQGYVFARPVTAEEAIGVAADIERSHRAARAVA